MHLYRDSENSFTITAKTSDGVYDLSDWTLRVQFYQQGKCIDLTIGDGLAFVTDGSDGQFELVLSKSRSNQLCVGTGKVMAFNDAGDDPVLASETQFVVEGKNYDA